MDKEQAIEKLNDIRCHVKETSAEEQALVMAIEALKAQLSQEGTTSDMVSRQEAIDVIEDYPHGNVWNVESMEEMVDKIKALPTAQPEPQWIPCSEKMPEEHEWIGTKKFGTTISDEVYVTFENEKGERFCQHMRFQNGELSRYDQSHIDTWFKGSKPIAWMPLPKPFE